MPRSQLSTLLAGGVGFDRVRGGSRAPGLVAASQSPLRAPAPCSSVSTTSVASASVPVSSLGDVARAGPAQFATGPLGRASPANEPVDAPEPRPRGPAPDNNGRHS